MKPDNLEMKRVSLQIVDITKIEKKQQKYQEINIKFELCKN